MCIWYLFKALLQQWQEEFTFNVNIQILFTHSLYNITQIIFFDSVLNPSRNSLVLEGTAVLCKKIAVWHLHFKPSRFRMTPNFSPPCFATILPVPESEGHKPKCNANNSSVVIQRHKWIALLALSCQSWSKIRYFRHAMYIPQLFLTQYIKRYKSNINVGNHSIRIHSILETHGLLSVDL